MLDTTNLDTLAKQLAHYAQIKKRLNTPLVPKPIKENPAPQTPSKSDWNPLASGEGCGAPPTEWVSAQDAIPPPPEPPHPQKSLNMVRTIAKAACAHTGITLNDLMAHRRHARTARTRQIVMYLAKEMTLYSFPYIGRQLAGRDHTTCMYGYHRIASLIQSDPQLAADVEAIRALVGVAE
jgi:hypothetical protein